MSLLKLEFLYVIAGLLLGHLAIRTARDRNHPRRWGTALFWGILGMLFLGGKALPPLVSGYMVLLLVVLAAVGQVRRPIEAAVSKETLQREADRFGNRLFGVALIIPATAVAGSLLLTRIHFGGWSLLDPRQATLLSLGLGALLALAAGCVQLRARPDEPMQEGGRLLAIIGWPLILPQLLAALGGIFAKAGVGEAVASIVTRTLPTQHAFVAVAAYCLGMAAFTVCMGNAFAAFPVMTLGIGLPLVVRQHGGDPAVMASIGMLSGFCGTLMTPMAANFNLVPAMLLELKDPHAVIKVQLPIALAILVANVLLMFACVFR